MTYRAPDRFTSTAELRLQSLSGGDAEALMAEARRLRSQALSRQTLALLMQQPLLDLYAQERRRQPIEDVVPTMKSRDLRIEIVPGAVPILRISYIGPDPWRTQTAVQSLLVALIDEHLNHPRTSFVKSVLEAPRSANPPERAPRPGPWRGEFVGLALGLFACFAFSTARRFPRTTAMAIVGALVAAPLSLTIPRPQTRQSLLAVNLPGVQAPLPGNCSSTPRPTTALEGQKAAFSAVSRLIDIVRTRRDSAGGIKPWLEIIDPTNLPTTPITHFLPLPFWFLVAGFLLGTAAGLVLKPDSKRNNAPHQTYKHA